MGGELTADILCFPYQGTSTFSEYTVLPEIAIAVVNSSAPMEKVCVCCLDVGLRVRKGVGA